MPRPDKIEQVEELKDRLSQASGVVLVDYLGLSAPQMVELRRSLRQQGVQFQVVKNTLARLAAQQAGVDFLLDYLHGPNGIVVGSDNPTAPFRAARECARKYQRFSIKVGLYSGEPIPPEQVEWIATLPSEQELHARLAGALNGPIQGMAVALGGVIRKPAVALSEVEKLKAQKE
ncbi:MAG: 50S ribosomal protein L10 [Candidatus Bipolaricaulota bacterium]